MADRLKLLLAVWLVLPSLAGAQVLADPTRPPPGFSEDQGAPGEAPGRVLQSVLIPAKGKPLAVIDGQQVRLGQRYGDATLIRLSEREAVLEGPQGVEHLLLTPGVEKTNVSPRPAKGGTKNEPARRAARAEG